MEHPPPGHDRALLTAAATIALPATVSIVLLILYIEEHSATGSLMLAGAIILAVTATGTACIQQHRRTRAAVDDLRDEMTQLRKDLQAARIDGAVTEIAGMVGKVVPLHRSNGKH
jgi:outer membrane murein-binding lipoprotein Lpp